MILDQKSLGITIAELRKKRGMTQAELAAKLRVSDKTVSKWENGLGFPEVTQFPTLAELFGVSIDFLMTGERKGIAIAGNILIDIIKNIECYPQIGMLAQVTDLSKAVGGCVPNTAINLAKIDRSTPIRVFGKIGDDEYGQYAISKMGQYGIDTSGVSIAPHLHTPFTDVMSLPTGERTFFHVTGSSKEFAPEDIDLATLNCSILHIGYILFMQQFDKEDPAYGTVMARFLCDAQEHGIKTSVDTVSQQGGDYSGKVIPALKYCNYAIMNEVEACNAFFVDPYENGVLQINRIRDVMQRMVEAGVSEKVILHSKMAGFCMDAVTGAFTVVPSLKIPDEEIKGSVGAGDAYCAACLYGLYHNFPDQKLLEFASSAAACNLFAANSIDGMLPKNEIMKLSEKYGRWSL